MNLKKHDLVPKSSSLILAACNFVLAFFYKAQKVRAFRGGSIDPNTATERVTLTSIHRQGCHAMTKLFTLLFLFPFSLLAATLYCGPTATGNGSGSDFNNRLALPNTTGFVRGNTYVLIEGSYGAKTFSTANSGSTLIIIRKGNATEDSAVAGWASSLVDGYADFGAMVFSTGYWILDGVTGGGPGSWASGYGFRINSGGKHVQFTATVSGIQFRHMDFYYGVNAGKPYPAGNSSVATGEDAFYQATGNASNITIAYCRIYRPGRTAFLTRNSWTGIVVEYTYFQECVIGYIDASDQHGELWSADHAANSFSLTFRYNWIYGFQSTGGLIMSGGNNVNIYGNLFETSGGQGNGVIANWTGGLTTSNVRIYNNTFVKCDARIGIGNNSGWTVQNNIFIGNYANGFNNVSTATHNAGDATLGSSFQSLNSSIFVNYAGGDYTLSGEAELGEFLDRLGDLLGREALGKFGKP